MSDKKDNNSLNKEIKLNPPEIKIWRYIILSLILHLSIIAGGALDINFGTRSRNYEKNSLNVAILEETPKEIKKNKGSSDRVKGRKLEIKKKKIKKEEKKVIEKKPLVSHKKKRMAAKKKIVEKSDLQKKKLPKRDIKKRDDTQEIKSLISEYKKDIEKTDNDNIHKVIDDIKEFKKDIKAQDGDNNKGFLSGISEGAKLAEKLEQYRYKIKFEIEKKWALPAELINKNQLEAYIVFSVLKDGSIVNIWFDTKSGNSYFDESVFRAVQKANPVSPHPEGIDKDSVVVGFRFAPDDLR